MSERYPPLEPAAWAQLAVRLAGYVAARLGRRGNPEDVAELTQECLRRMLDSRYRGWDAERESFFEFATSVANGLVRNHWRRASRRAEVGGRDIEQLGGDDVSADGAIDRRRAVAALRERLEGDAIAGEVLEAMLRGCERPRDLVVELGYSPRVIRNARRRLMRHVEALLDESDR